MFSKSGSATATNSNLQSAKTMLGTIQNQLMAAQAQLSSTQSSLNTYSSLYLPPGIAIPAIVAALFAILYLRKNAKPAAPGST